MEGLTRIREMLSNRALPKLEPVTFCEVVPLDGWRWQLGQQHCAGFRATFADGRDSQWYPPECLGISGWFNDDIACTEAGHVISRMYGVKATCNIAYTENPDHKRHQVSAAASQAAIAEFPKRPGLYDLKVTDWNREALRRCKVYVRDFAKHEHSGQGLRIADRQTGSGKTTLMVATIMELLAHKPFIVKYLFIPDMTQMRWDDKERQKLLTACKECDILLLDDVDATVTAARSGDPDASFGRSFLLPIVNDRDKNERLTFWTSNSPDEATLEKALGDRLARRLYDSAIPLRFDKGAWDWERGERENV